MNLQEILSEEGLQQDGWSLSQPSFGAECQLEVVGWSGKHGSGHKLYILICHKCNQDSELFGEGYFKSVKGDLVRRLLPCGCARSPRWSKDQFAILCSRKAVQLGYIFLGFIGDWKGASTKIKMLCEKHGEWTSGNINDLTRKDSGCPACRTDVVAKASTKPDNVMIDSFFASGAFHPQTKFWRSDRKNSQGYKIYWFVSCPDCGETGESVSNNLQQGCRSCACSTHRQKECYINWVVEDCEAVAIKFGIANNSKRRVKQQNLKTTYTLKQHSVYTFPDVTSCKNAERECKQELECGVVLKRDMSDGYTETTWVYNLDKIIEIYERNEGVRK